MLPELPSTSVLLPVELHNSAKSGQNSESQLHVVLSEVAPGEDEDAESSGGFRWQSMAFAGQASSTSSSVGSLASVASAASDDSGDDDLVGQRFSWSFAPLARPRLNMMDAEAQMNAAVKLQSHWRGWLSRHAFLRLRNLARHLQRSFMCRRHHKTQEARSKNLFTLPLRRPPGSSEVSADARKSVPLHEKSTVVGRLRPSTAIRAARVMGTKDPEDDEEGGKNLKDIGQTCMLEPRRLAQKQTGRTFVQQTKGVSRTGGFAAGRLHVPLRKQRVFAAAHNPRYPPAREEAFETSPRNLVESAVLSDLLHRGLLERVDQPEGYPASALDEQMLATMQSLSANLPRGARVGFVARVATAAADPTQHKSSGKGAIASAAAYEAARQSLGPERLLWHGTSWESVPNIVRHGFNRAYAFNARHGSKLGRGVYFTEDAAYALRFAKQSSNSRALFLAGVLPGHMTRGQEGLIEPPVANAFGARFDSTADDPLWPRVICVFRDFQALPLYVVQVIS